MTVLKTVENRMFWASVLITVVSLAVLVYYLVR